MIVIRPPEYFPRPEYAALLLEADYVVLADTFPFSRQGYHNRSRIRTAQERGWMWLTVPRMGGTVGAPVQSVPIDYGQPWMRTHRRAVHINYSMAPFFEFYKDGVDALLKREWPSLSTLTVATTRWLMEALGATAPLVCASSLPGAPDSLPAVWASLSGEVLGTLPESAEGDALHLQAQDGIVRVLRFEETARRQNFPGFIGGTSALDLLFNYGPDAGAMLREGVTGWRDVVVGDTD